MSKILKTYLDFLFGVLFCLVPKLKISVDSELQTKIEALKEEKKCMLLHGRKKNKKNLRLNSRLLRQTDVLTFT